MRVLRGQFSLCNFLCNAAKIRLAGFVWFTVLATCHYLSFLEIDIRFIEKQVFCLGLADLADLVSLVSLVGLVGLVSLVGYQAKNLLFNKPYSPLANARFPVCPVRANIVPCPS